MNSQLTTVPSDVIHWKESSDGRIPPGALVAGRTLENELLYVGRARLRENKNELTPGMIIPSQRCLILSYGTGVRRAPSYEVLVAKDPDIFHWVECRSGSVPVNAIIGGMDCSYLEPLYVGRTRGPLEAGKTWRGQRLQVTEESFLGQEECQLPGKIHRTHKCLYIPYNDKEYLFRDYEVLVMKETPSSLSVLSRASLLTHLFSKVASKLKNCSESERTKTENQTDFLLNKFIHQLPLPDKLKQFCKSEELNFLVSCSSIEERPEESV